MRPCTILALASILALLSTAPASAAPRVEANRLFEHALTASKNSANPSLDITVDVVFTDPAGEKFRVPAFWAGGNIWKVRYASPRVGKHTFLTECSAAEDQGLHGVRGEVEIIPYSGDNPLYRRGPLRVAQDKRHFEYADGTPFFWLGDTWWKGLCDRIPWDGFQKLTADRKAKGFTVAQIIAGPYPDERPFDPRWANEGGMPYLKDYQHVNPAYFDMADRRIQHLLDAGMVPAIVGGWGWHMPKVGVENFNRHWRYLIARYGAQPVVWIVGGEAGGPQWTEVVAYVRKNDPYHRLITVHPYPGSGRKSLTDDKNVDFDMLQTGHGGDWHDAFGTWPKTAASTVAKVMSAYSKTPTMPVVVGEVVYEGHMLTNGPEAQRQVFWSSMLSGAAGHTYGAGGIWQMNSDTVRGAEYEYTPWHEAMRLPGSTQLGLGKKLLEEYPWWRFKPHPEWVEPHSTTLFEPHDKWYDENKEFQKRGGKWDLPYAAGIPGEVRVIYLPGHYYKWDMPAVKNLERDIPYRVFLFDPATGKRYRLGTIINAGPQPHPFGKLKGLPGGPPKRDPRELPLIREENPNVVPAVAETELTILPDGTYHPSRLPAPQDWVLVLERVKQE